MFEGRNLLMLEALEHGRILFDHGAFGTMRQEFSRWRAEGEVTPFEHGWKIRG